MSFTSSHLRGLVAAPHTPFHSDGSLAPEIVELQAAHLAASGVGTAFVTGTTGECHSLTRAERVVIFAAWAEAGPKHGIEVVGHVGSNCLEDARYFMAAVADHGFRAAAAVAPTYFKPPTVEVLVRCCEAIASAAPQVPFYYYDIPVFTGLSYDAAEFLRLAGPAIPNLAGIKFTRDDLAMFQQCRRLEEGKFDLLWGIDEKLVDALARGAEGAVGSTYNFAAPLYHELMRELREGNVRRARELQAEAVSLVETLAAVGYFGAAKALMGWLGVPVGPPRLPLPTPPADALAKLREKLEAFPWFGCRLGGNTPCPAPLGEGMAIR